MSLRKGLTFEVAVLWFESCSSLSNTLHLFSDKKQNGESGLTEKTVCISLEMLLWFVLSQLDTERVIRVLQKGWTVTVLP